MFCRKIPDQGNRAELTLTCLHRNNLSLDEFLGQVTLPLNEMDVYDRPRAKWFKLESKPGKEKKNKERGELEVRIAFVVKSGSLTDLSKKDKHKSSIGQLASSVGGSLLSIGNGEKRRSIKKLAGSLSSKLHIRSKKKQEAGGDDSSSFGGSFASLGTPNSSTGRGQNGGSGRRRGGQRAGEADPGVISEDEDEFVFDNLSHKSSGSSLNIQRSGLQPPAAGTPNFAPRHPSPLLNNNNGVSSVAAKGKPAGRPATLDEDDVPIDAEMEQLELDFSVRAHARANSSAVGGGGSGVGAGAGIGGGGGGLASTLPPSKPPRIPEQVEREREREREKEREQERERELKLEMERKKQQELDATTDEWASKLYGGGKFLEIGTSDSLKRRSWEARVPIPASTDEPPPVPTSSSSSSSSSESDEEEPVVVAKPPAPKAAPPSLTEIQISPVTTPVVPVPVVLSTPKVPTPVVSPPVAPSLGVPAPLASSSALFSPEVEHRNFDTFNASFAKFEQRNSTAIFADEPELEDLEPEPERKAPTPTARPKPQPRVLIDARAEEEKARQQRAEEDARLEAELRLNEQRLREEEAALQRELEEEEAEREREREQELERQKLEEQRRREAKRWEEDQRLLSFAKRSTSLEEPMGTKIIVPVDPEAEVDVDVELDLELQPEHNFLTPEQSPKEFQTNGGEKRLGKFKYGNKRGELTNPNHPQHPNQRNHQTLPTEAGGSRGSCTRNHEHETEPSSLPVPKTKTEKKNNLFCVMWHLLSFYIYPLYPVPMFFFSFLHCVLFPL